MFYVVRHGDQLEKYHAAYVDEWAAKQYAENLKQTFGHQYTVIKVEAVWTTQPLGELKTASAL